MLYIKDPKALTPVERLEGGLYVKRDDLFMPYLPTYKISGGKVRQLINLIECNLDAIKSDFAGNVATYGSVHSPQLPIVSIVARRYGLHAILGVSGGDNVVESHRTLKNAQRAGGEVVVLGKGMFDSGLLYRLKSLQKERRFFMIHFGFGMDRHRDVLLGAIAEQVKNIPEVLDYLLIPTGSAITATGILMGIQRFGKRVGSVMCLQTAGYDRSSTIDKYAVSGERYEMIVDKTYPYSRRLKRSMDNGTELDDIYEAKAYDWYLRKAEIFRGKRTLFWIVGNANKIRDEEVQCG